MISAWSVLWSELAGTATLMAFGVGVAANIRLRDTTGNGQSYLMGTLGWAMGVLSGVYVAHLSGGHLNPAFTIAVLVQGSGQYAPDVPVTAATTAAYLVGEVLGATLGSMLAWAAYWTHMRLGVSEGETLTVFATKPRIRNLPANLLTEAIATFLLVMVILHVGGTPSGLGPLATALVVMGIGLGMGGPTGWAVNPARDLGSRIAHALLPIGGKGSSDWAYSWVPVLGPILGGVVAGLIVPAIPG